MPVESTDKEVEQLALQSSKVQAQLEDKQIAKVINVPGKLVNIVTQR